MQKPFVILSCLALLGGVAMLHSSPAHAAYQVTTQTTTTVNEDGAQREVYRANKAYDDSIGTSNGGSAGNNSNVGAPGGQTMSGDGPIKAPKHNHDHWRHEWGAPMGPSAPNNDQ